MEAYSIGIGVGMYGLGACGLRIGAGIGMYGVRVCGIGVQSMGVASECMGLECTAFGLALALECAAMGCTALGMALESGCMALECTAVGLVEAMRMMVLEVASELAAALILAVASAIGPYKAFKRPYKAVIRAL